MDDIIYHCMIESCTISFISKQRTCFSKDTLDELGDRHSARDGVGINDDIGNDSVFREGHIALIVDHAGRAFLSVSGGEFISYFGDFHIP